MCLLLLLCAVSLYPFLNHSVLLHILKHCSSSIKCRVQGADLYAGSWGEQTEVALSQGFQGLDGKLFPESAGKYFRLAGNQKQASGVLKVQGHPVLHSRIQSQSGLFI